MILDDSGDVTAIVEAESRAPPRAAPVRVINSGIYCFRAELLWKHIGEIQPEIRVGRILSHRHGGDPDPHGPPRAGPARRRSGELLGINTRVELADADRVLRARKAAS